MQAVEVLVIGAGPTGIGAAHRLHELGTDWLLVESGSGPGGMAGSVTDQHGFVWDLGGHVLHSHFEEFDKAIADCGIELLYPARNGWVWLGGELVPTPIQHQVRELPADLDPGAPVANLADYYRNNFGAELFSSFFQPFTEKMWATPLTHIDDAWTSLRNGSAERNVPSIRVRNTEPSGSAPNVVQPIRFPYPAGGTGRLWDALTARLESDRIRYDSPVTAIDLTARLAILATGEQIAFQHCVSTMPLTQLLQAVGDTALAARAPEFVANQVFVVGLGFDGEPPLSLADKSWLYCPDADVAWHRATMLSNYDPENAGVGRWSVLCEVGRSSFREIGDAEAIASCLRSLWALGADPAALVSTWTKTVPMGYPVPTRGRDEALVAVDALLSRAGVRSRGRFGGWRYESCNQDYSFMQGIQAVDAALSGAEEDAYWRPEHS